MDHITLLEKRVIELEIENKCLRDKLIELEEKYIGEVDDQQKMHWLGTRRTMALAGHRARYEQQNDDIVLTDKNAD